MRVYRDLYRFVSVCTSLFCKRIIVKDSGDLYRFGGNTGAKTGTGPNVKKLPGGGPSVNKTPCGFF